MVVKSFFRAEDKQGHMLLVFAIAGLAAVSAWALGCPHLFLAGFLTAMLLLGGKEVWDANKPLPAGSHRNGWREHALDLLADAIGAAAALLLLYAALVLKILIVWGW